MLLSIFRSSIRSFVPLPFRLFNPFVPSSLRPFVPSSLRPIVPSSHRPLFFFFYSSPRPVVSSLLSPLGYSNTVFFWSLLFHFSFSSFNCISEEETEDDEVSEAVLKAKPTVVPEILVPALTDKTFDTVKKENDLLVVDFFQPCKLLRQIMKLYLNSDVTSWCGDLSHQNTTNRRKYRLSHDLVTSVKYQPFEAHQYVLQDDLWPLDLIF